MLLAILGGILCQILLFAFALILLKSSISKLKKGLFNYFSPPSTDQESPFASTVESISAILAKHIVNSVKGYLLSLNSAEVRSAKAEQRQALQEAAPPLVSALLGAFPALGKKIMRNPEVAQLAFSAIQNMSQRKEPQSSNNGHSEVENPFNL